MPIIRQYNGAMSPATYIYRKNGEDFQPVKRVLRRGQDGVFREAFRRCLLRTAEGSLIQCYPTEGTSLSIRVGFAPVETLPEDGEKGPENPSVISGWDEIEVVRCGEETSSDDESYIGNTYTIELPDTFYGGYIDFSRGVLVQEWAYATVTPNMLDAVLTYLDDTFVQVPFETAIPYYEDSLEYDQPFIFCSMFTQRRGASYYYWTPYEVRKFASGSSLAGKCLGFYIPDTLTLEAYKEFFATHTVNVAYKLATPIEHQLTHLVPIKALAGVNTVYSNTNGHVTVDYCLDEDTNIPAVEHSLQSAALVSLGVQPTYNLAEDTATLAGMGVEI